MRPGVPDLWLPVPRHGFSGLVIELKAGRGRVTPEQDDWLNFLASQNFAAVMCRGAVSAIKTIKGYLDDQGPNDRRTVVAHNREV